MFRIEMLPARHGDSLLIEYGNARAPNRILIDGGASPAAEGIRARLAAIGSPAQFEMVMVSHVDSDHIGGMLSLLAAGAIATKDFWFNSYRHLFPPGKLGGKQGEQLTAAIAAAGFAQNAAFGGGSVVVPDDGPLPVAKLAGGAKVTLLSPTWPKLEKLRVAWEAECEAAGLVPGKAAPPADRLGKRPPPTKIDVAQLTKAPFKQDGSAANGSSIAVLLEVGGKRALLGADAHPGVLLASLQRYSAEPVEIDAFKTCHHGSQSNLSADLLDHLDCKRFLFSSDGGLFGHPDPEALARVIARPGKKQLYFNYDSEYTRPWSKQALRSRYSYEIEMPEDEAGGMIVDL